MARSTQELKDVPMVSNYPALEAWLVKHNGRCLFQEQETDKRRIEGWSINGTLVIVVLYADGHGFNVYTDVNTNSIEATLADAERRIGLDTPKPIPSGEYEAKITMSGDPLGEQTATIVGGEHAGRTVTIPAPKLDGGSR